jgi:hypothetical protein
MKNPQLSRFLLFPLIFSLFILFNSCSEKEKRDTVQRGIYWWGRDMQAYMWGIEEYLPWLKERKIERIYYKLYDIDWNGVQGIYPSHGPFHSPSHHMMNLYYEFIPCVFITNRVFENAADPELDEMATRIASKIDTSHYEYQVDCDWTEGTKEKFFYFLNVMKKKFPKKTLSVTLRLYQHKYPEKTGVPPADRCALMLYNFNSPKTYSEKNSIFDKAEAEKYFSDKTYPLPLDFILPSFSWSVIYHEKEFAGLLRDFNRKDASTYCTKLGENRYRCELDTVVESFYLRNGYEIKIEEVNEKMLTDAKTLVKEFKNTDHYTLSVFSLSAETQNLINHEVSEKIFGTAD